MHPRDERPISILVSGVPEALRTEAAEHASSQSLRVRLAIHHKIHDELHVRFLRTEEARVVTIYVLADALGATMRRAIAWLTEDALRRLCREYNLPAAIYVFEV